MRIATAEHEAQPWRIHEVVPDFRLEDVWEIPVDLGPDDFPRIVAAMAEQHPEQTAGPVVAVLLKVRRVLGNVLNWDDLNQGVGGRVPSLRERLPADLRDGPRGPAANGFPFEPLYFQPNEFAAEMANATVQGVMHLGLVETSPGVHRGRMAVLVRPNGRLGRVYMAAIKPIRYWIVYPLMLRAMARRWSQVTQTRPCRAVWMSHAASVAARARTTVRQLRWHIERVQSEVIESPDPAPESGRNSRSPRVERHVRSSCL